MFGRLGLKIAMRDKATTFQNVTFGNKADYGHSLRLRMYPDISLEVDILIPSFETNLVPACFSGLVHAAERGVLSAFH